MRCLLSLALLACLVLVSGKPAQHVQPTHQQQPHDVAPLKPHGVFEDVYLVNGIPTNGYIRTNNTWVYYIFNIPTSSRAAVQASVTPIFGSPSLYISCNGRPTASSYTWMSPGTSATVVILITRAQLDAQCQSGHMYIGVYTNGFPSDFMVESNTQDVQIQLQDGVAQAGVAGPTATYYQYVITGNLTASLDTVIDVTPISGIPTLYINCGDVPSTSSYRWKSDVSTGLQQIRIVPNDICTDQKLWIGIFSLPTTDPSSFEITVTSGAVATELQSGKATRGGAVANEYSDYVFNFQPGQTISIEATVVYGDALTIYGSCTQAPDANTFTWKADVSESGSVELIIPSTDPAYCQLGFIYLSTISPNAHNFVIVAHDTSDIIELVNGIPIYDKLEKAQVNYYTISIPSQAINWGTTWLHGDGNVYVSCNNTQPGPSSYDYTGDFMELPRLACSTLYISITATQQTSYLFVASHPTSSVQLLNDVKQHDMIGAGETRYYQLMLGKIADTAVSVMSVSTDATLVYQFFISCDQQHPSKSINTWSSPGGTNPNQQILIAADDPHVCQTYYIAVITSEHNRTPIEVILSGFSK